LWENAYFVVLETRFLCICKLLSKWNQSSCILVVVDAVLVQTGASRFALGETFFLNKNLSQAYFAKTDPRHGTLVMAHYQPLE